MKIKADIPNNIHMMWFVNDKSRPFSFVNYLAVRAAKEVHNPDNLFMYYNVDLPDNPHWQAAKQYATFVQVEALTEFEGIHLSFPQYQADVFRLQKLYNEGGIYLDTDAITTKPFTELLHNHCVLGVDHKHEVIPNGMMLARPGHPFLKRWLDSLASELNNPVWATHAVVLPYRLYKEDPSQIDEYDVDLFLPFGWEDKFILGTDLNNLQRLQNCYCIHMWESMWAEVADIDQKYLRGDTVFANMFRKYATPKISFIGDLSNSDARTLYEVSRHKSVLEFGVGGSTQLFAQSAANVVSVDTDLVWVNRTKNNLALLPNHTPVDFQELALFDYQGKYDVIFVDGTPEKRLEFAEAAWSCLNKNGVMIFHDTREFKYFREVAWLVQLHFAEISCVEINKNDSNLSLIYKRDTPKHYENWNDVEGKPLWARGYGERPEGVGLWEVLWPTTTQTGSLI